MPLDFKIDLSYKDKNSKGPKAFKIFTEFFDTNIDTDVVSSLYDLQSGYSIVEELTRLQSGTVGILNQELGSEWGFRQVRAKDPLHFVVVYENRKDLESTLIESPSAHYDIRNDGVKTIGNNMIRLYFAYSRLQAIAGKDGLKLDVPPCTTHGNISPIKTYEKITMPCKEVYHCPNLLMVEINLSQLPQPA